MPTKPESSEIAALVNQLFAAKAEYHRLAYDEEYPGQLGEPASEADIARVEAILGAPLPSEYKEFLRHHDGWAQFAGDGKLLSTADHETTWAKAIAESWSSTWDSDDPDPFETRHLLIMAGPHLPYFIVLEPEKRNAAEEPVFREYEDGSLERTHETFGAYLRNYIEVMESLIDDERSGVGEG